MPKATSDPLGKVSDEELVRQVQEGAPQIFADLLQRFLPTICYHAAKYASAMETKEDLVQEGSIALMDAVSGYDPQRQVRFATYANRCIAHGIQKAVERGVADKRRSMKDFLPLDALENLHLVHDTPDEVVISRESMILLHERIAALLSGFEQEALKLYLSGRSYQEMANALNTSTKAVDNALQRIRRKLRKTL